MQLFRIQRSLLKPVMAGLLALLLPVIGLLAVNSQLHQRFCAGADTQDHQCVVTMFAQGHVDSLDATPVFASFTVWISEMISPVIAPELPSVEFLLLPERAPPLSLS